MLTLSTKHCAKRCARYSALFVMGEDVGKLGGLFRVTKGLLEEWM